ncbi:MAG: MarR family transcriptional regulator [Gemmatimonadales bacterium]|nr:MarR family transcriptional regulator [Gemmatimonadales bacterium]
MSERPAPPILGELRQKRPFASKAEEAVVTLFRTTDVIRRAGEAVVAPHGISAQQYNVLRILRGAGRKGLQTLEIAERLVERAPGITRLVDALEKKKLVERERCVEDRRVVWCRITKAGLALLATLDAPVTAHAERTMRKLSAADLNKLTAILDDIRIASA